MRCANIFLALQISVGVLSRLLTEDTVLLLIKPSQTDTLCSIYPAPVEFKFIRYKESQTRIYDRVVSCR